MLNEILTRILTKYIINYVYELNPNSVHSSLLRGVVELNNLFIRPEVLDTLPGVKLKLGYIERISLRIPWKSFWKENISIKVSTVYVVAYSCDPELTENTIKQQVLNNLRNKLKSLARIEQCIMEQNRGKIVEEIDKTTSVGGKRTGRMKKWILWLQNFAINNITLSINNTVILWSSPKLMGVSAALCIHNILVFTAHDSSANTSGLKEKDCAVDNITLRYYPVSVYNFPNHNYNSVAECEKDLVFWRRIFEESSHMTVINPFQVTIVIQLCRNFVHEAKPFATILLHMPSIHCCTDLRTILSLVESLSTSISIGDFAFALTTNEINYLDKDCLPEDAIRCLGEVLLRDRIINQIDMLILQKENTRSLLLKEYLHQSFQRHYFSHLRYKYVMPLLSKQPNSSIADMFTDDYLKLLQKYFRLYGAR